MEDWGFWWPKEIEPVKKLVYALMGLGVLALSGLALGFVFDRSSYVGLVEVEGTITDATSTVEWIDKLSEDSRVKAILVKVNSPGGGVVASDEIYRALLRAKKQGKPVVVYMGSIAASGGYYLSCAADTIVAAPGTMTGSIGVIMSFPVVEKAMEKIGVDMDVVKSAEHKGIASPFRSRTPEEMALLDSTVMDVYDQFVDVVASARPLSKQEVLAVADGRIVTGRQALDLGLVDKLGDFHDAFETAKKMGKCPQARLMKKTKQKGLLYYLVFGDEDEESAFSRLKTVLSPSLEFRWAP